MFLSVFDVFKIGIGPSSSHTMGPMTAALRFLDEIKSGAFPKAGNAQVTRLSVSLHGSLAYAGVGHATDRAVILGLCGYAPDTIDPDDMDKIIDRVEKQRIVAPEGHPPYQFNPETDLIMDRKERLEGHANGMRFRAYDQDDQMILSRIFYSIGGGFVVTDIELKNAE